MCPICIDHHLRPIFTKCISTPCKPNISSLCNCFLFLILLCKAKLITNKHISRSQGFRSTMRLRLFNNNNSIDFSSLACVCVCLHLENCSVKPLCVMSWTSHISLAPCHLSRYAFRYSRRGAMQHTIIVHYLRDWTVCTWHRHSSNKYTERLLQCALECRILYTHLSIRMYSPATTTKNTSWNRSCPWYIARDVWCVDVCAGNFRECECILGLWMSVCVRLHKCG